MHTAEAIADGVEAPRPQDLGPKIDALQALKDQYDGKNAELSIIKDAIDAAELGILRLMRELGLQRAAGAGCSVTVTENVVPHVDDWDLVLNYIKENDCLHFLQKRLSVTVLREYFDSKVEIPGMHPSSQFRLNSRRS